LLKRNCDIKGKFKITCTFFTSHQVKQLTGGTTVIVKFFTNYLRDDEKSNLVTIRLNQEKQEVEVCEIDFK
jgi:hypothetical protein